jgi:hypothetical protein
MGADGHIQIYSLDKLYEKYDEKTVGSFLSHVGLSSISYKQELEGKQYLTRYHGDNLDVIDSWDTLYDTYDVDKNTWNEKSYYYDSYTAEYLDKVGVELKQIFWYMIDHLENQCKLTSWEVWT